MNALTPLNPSFDALLQILHGAAPINLETKDTRGWGKKGFYSVKEGYEKLYMERPHHPYSRMWAKIWKHNGLLEVNIFS